MNLFLLVVNCYLMTCTRFSWEKRSVSQITYSIYLFIITFNSNIMIHFQSPHNTVTYSIIGDGTAQTLFSINPATGFITTRQSLQNNNVERSSVSATSTTNWMYMYTYF